MLVVSQSRLLRALLRRHLLQFFLEERVVAGQCSFPRKVLDACLEAEHRLFAPVNLWRRCAGKHPELCPSRQRSTARGLPLQGPPWGALPALRGLWQEERTPPQHGGRGGGATPTAGPAGTRPRLRWAPPRHPAATGERQAVAPSGAVIGPRRRQSPVAAATRTPSRRHTPAPPLSAPDWPERRWRARGGFTALSWSRSGWRGRAAGLEAGGRRRRCYHDVQAEPGPLLQYPLLRLLPRADRHHYPGHLVHGERLARGAAGAAEEAVIWVVRSAHAWELGRCPAWERWARSGQRACAGGGPGRGLRGAPRRRAPPPLAWGVVRQLSSCQPSRLSPVLLRAGEAARVSWSHPAWFGPLFLPGVRFGLAKLCCPLAASLAVEMKGTFGAF